MASLEHQKGKNTVDKGVFSSIRLLMWVVLVVTLGAGLHSVLWNPRASASAIPEEFAPVALLSQEGEAQSYWPRWRGPSGQGLVSGSGYPDRWTDTENVLWKVSVPGEGNSSPIVWRDQIFLTTARDRGRRRSILSFRRSDGALLWETLVPSANPEWPHAKNGYASSTPVTDGESVFAYFGSHGLVAVDLEGRIVWHRPLTTPNPYHGTAGSPVLYEDSVILYQEDQSGSAASFIAAFDKRTGAVRWKRTRQERVGWGTPIVIRVGERDELIVSSQRKVYAYNPKTGVDLWSCRGNTVEVIPTPVVGHGLLFCPSGRAGPTLAIRPGGGGDVTDTHLVWRSPKGSPFVPSPILVGDYLYMVNDMASVASCYEAKTGKLLWQGRMGRATREGFSASPVAVDGKIFFTNDAGETFVLKEGPEFQLLHVNRLGARTLASPALVDGTWYFRTAAELLAIGSGG